MNSRELDVLVAEKVMGLRVRVEDVQIGSYGNGHKEHAPGEPIMATFYRVVDDKGEYIMAHGPLMHGYGPVQVPHYSTDIVAVWQVVEHFRDFWTKATAIQQADWNNFQAPFDDSAFFDVLRRHADRRWPWAFLYVTPEAICLAALKAVGVEIEI